MTRRGWSEADDAALRALYGTMPAAEVGQRLRRTEDATNQRAVRIGLTEGAAAKRERCRQVRQQVVQLHAAGLCDSEIARRLGSQQSTIRKHRVSLGLPVLAEAVRATRSDRLRAKATQRLAAGEPPLIVRRRAAHRRMARRHGWPADLPGRCVQILNVLAQVGPRTKRQLAEAIGMRSVGHKLLQCRTRGSAGETRSYTTILVDRGLIAVIAVVGRGRTHLYGLTPQAAKYRKELFDARRAAERDAERDADRPGEDGPR